MHLGLASARAHIAHITPRALSCLGRARLGLAYISGAGPLTSFGPAYYGPAYYGPTYYGPTYYGQATLLVATRGLRATLYSECGHRTEVYSPASYQVRRK